jgi:hypothetical protein
VARLVRKGLIQAGLAGLLEHIYASKKTLTFQ